MARPSEFDAELKDLMEEARRRTTKRIRFRAAGEGAARVLVIEQLEGPAEEGHRLYESLKEYCALQGRQNRVVVVPHHGVDLGGASAEGRSID